MTPIPAVPTLPEILPASVEWAYPEIEADYPRNVWREVSASFIDQALNVLPPIYSGGGFLVLEPWNHTREGRPIYAGFVQLGARYFARMSTVQDFSQAVEYLRRAI